MLIVWGLYSRIWKLFLHHPAPPVRSPCKPTNKEVAELSNGAVGAALLIPVAGEQQKQRCGFEFATWHDIYTPEECADEWRQNNADFKLLCHEWFHHVGHCTGEFPTVIWRPGSFTASFPGDVPGDSGLRELASVNRRTPQWARFTKTIMPAWFEKRRDIKFWYMC